jgi:hypothetical protein
MSLTNEPDMPAPREALLTRFAQLKRGPWEGLATGVIALGVVMLMQPLSLALYTYSFVTMLAGTVMFVVVSHFRD